MTLNKFLDISIPILMGVLGIGIQKFWIILKSNQYNLENHKIITDLFVDIQKIKNWEVIGNRQVFIDALKIKLEVWKDAIEKLTKEFNRKYQSRQHLRKIFIEWTMNTIEIYNQKWENAGIPEKVINHINKIHQEKVDRFLAEINEIINDRSYPTLQFIKREVLNTLRLLLAETKDDFNDIIYRMRYNGQFRGVYYKDIPINDDEYQKKLKGL